MTTLTSTHAADKQTQLKNLLENDEFSVAEYLNLALHNNHRRNEESTKETNEEAEEEEEEEEALMTEMALQLQLQTQACHDEIGRYMVEVGAMIPRLTADVGRIGVGLNGMREDASLLVSSSSSASVAAVADGGGKDDLVVLSSLHSLRDNLLEARTILEAASSWDSTVASMYELLGSISGGGGDDADAAVSDTLTEEKASSSSASSHADGGDTSKVAPTANTQESAALALGKVVEALGKLEYGADALDGTPGSEERLEEIQSFRSKIEVLLKPMLLRALQLQATGPLSHCVSMYKTLNKLDILKVEYVKSRPANIHKLWYTFNVRADVSFPVWLSTTWYDACLTLITDERRRIASIFGDDDAPAVTAEVLHECFRPLTSSFESRFLAYTKSNSHDVVCDVYRDTLRFLSAAYDQVIGCQLNVVENIFVSIIQPFAPYLVENDSRYMAISLKALMDPIQSSGTNNNNGENKEAHDTYGSITDATQQLFPLVKMSLARYETLCCGCQAIDFINSIDAVVGEFTNELSIQISTLSASFKNDMNDSLDNNILQTCLESLKMAGMFLENLSAFGQLLQERFRSLLTGIDSSVKQEVQGMPDSLSTGEVGVMVARSVIGKKDEKKNIADLQFICELLPQDITKKLLVSSFASATKLGKACKRLVFDACVALPEKMLMSLNENYNWGENVVDGEDIMRNYSILPQAYITQVGEHILALVQALEPFAASEENVMYANKVMSSVDEVARESWMELVALMGCIPGQDDTVISSIIHGTNLPDFVQGIQFDQEEDDDNDSEDLDESHVFCNHWLAVVSTAIVGRLLERILRINYLGSKGCKHLAADLGYIENVFLALGIDGHPHHLLHHFYTLASTDLSKQIDILKSRKLMDDMDKIEEAIAQAESRFLQIQR